MPELPEVQTMCRGIAAVVGRRIVRACRPPSRLESLHFFPAWPRLRPALAGRTILDVRRIGKRVTLGLDGGDRLVIEPRMTGLVLLCSPPDRAHVRVVFELEPVGQILFWDQRGLGVVRLLSAAAAARLYALDRLGPDALEASVAELRARLAASRRPIKVALMDQRALAGIGNLYASEILHRAGVDPRRSCRDLAPDQWRAVHRAMRAILAAAIRCEGSTLADGTYRVGREQVGGYQRHHRVYQRAGEPCRRCKGPIERIVQAQRSTFFCPRCQD